MAKLRKAEQLYIIRSLAQFMTPTEVVNDIKDKLNVVVTPQQVEAYDPTKVAGKDLRQEFKDEFNKSREEYLKQPIHNISGANDLVQLKILSDLLFAKKTNVILAIKIIDQIQKIAKGYYEKRLEITGKDGGPIQQETKTTPLFTPEQIAGMTAQELSRLAITGKL